MSIGVAIDLRDTARPTLTRLRNVISGQEVSVIAGQAAVRVYKDHLQALDSSRPNRLGGKRTHFYGSAAGGTSFRAEPDGVTVSIVSDGIAQRYFGGTIRPKRAKYLTIPVHPAAHGFTAREFTGKLKVRFGRGRVPVALVTERGVTMFVLRQSVTQAPDPTVLPAPEAVAAAIVRDLERELADQVRRGGAR